MNIQEYIEKFTTLQINILEFIDSKEDSEEKFQNITKNIEDFKIKEYRHEFQSLLYLISKISNNHFRVPDFFSKIHKILQLLKEDISKKFGNLEIFDIFKSNKKLFLILIDEQILKFDENVANEIKKSKSFGNYSKFFYPEIKPFLTADQLNQIVFNQDNFEEKRKLGENDTEICQIIRDDSIKEFIEFVQKNNFKINHTIEPSIYETNSFLLKYQKEFGRQPTYIEYAAFFGSIEIFEYLISNTVIIDSNLLLFAVHSNSPIIMSFFEENQIEADNKFYKKCLNEAIKCHHNEMANYIQQNYINQKPRKSEIINYFKLEKNDQEFYMKGVVACSLKYYNFAFFPNVPKDKYLLFYAAKFNYFKIVEFLLNSRKINVNEKVISNKNFFKNKISNKKFVMFEMFIFNLTALQIVAGKNHSDIVDLLISQPEIEIRESYFKGNLKIRKIRIPVSITKIKSYVFSRCTSLNQVSLPSTLKMIKSFAFEGCSSLNEISIPSSVTSIGKSAFENCFSLRKVSLPSSIQCIEDKTFNRCKKIVEITIPDSVTRIGISSFANCISLTKISFSSNVKKIGNFAFSLCESLIEFPLNSILNQRGVYMMCSSLKKVKIPPTTTSIGLACFSKCTSLEEVEIPSSVIRIQDKAFFDCSSLKKIVIPFSVILIGISGFENCSSLTSVEFGKYSSLESIRDRTFFGCKSLTKIVFPKSIKKIGSFVLGDCPSLEEIIYYKKTEIIESSFPNGVKIQKGPKKKKKSIRHYNYHECDD